MEQVTKHRRSNDQEEILRRYCSEAERLLGEASDLGQAIGIRNRLCTRLQNECSSGLLLNATRAYVDRIISAKWSTHVPGPDLPGHQH